MRSIRGFGLMKKNGPYNPTLNPLDAVLKEWVALRRTMLGRMPLHTTRHHLVPELTRLSVILSVLNKIKTIASETGAFLAELFTRQVARVCRIWPFYSLLP